MVVLSSIVLAAGLAGFSQAAPTTKLQKADGSTVAATVVPAIGFSTEPIPAAHAAAAAKAPFPEIISLTPAEFEAWAANTTNQLSPQPQPGPVKARSDFNKRLTIGSDDRFYQPSSDWPWAALGRVYIPVPTGYYYCTGTLVGPRIIATARHCLKEGAQSFLFSPGYDNGDHFPTGYATQIVHLATDTSIGGCDDKNDWAIFVLDQPLGSQRGLLWPGDYIGGESTVSGKNILTVGGYPSDLSNGQQLYITTGRTTSLAQKASCTNEGPVFGDADISNGMAGGPLIIQQGDGRWTYGTVVGALVDSNGNELNSVHAHGTEFVNAINQLNTQYPS